MLHFFNFEEFIGLFSEYVNVYTHIYKNYNFLNNIFVLNSHQSS